MGTIVRWRKATNQHFIAWPPRGDELAALSDVAVARVTAAAHGAMVCFVLVVVASHLAGLRLGMIGQVGLVGAFLAVAGALAVRSRRPGGRG